MGPSNEDTFTGFSLTDTPYARLQEHFRGHDLHFETDDAKQLVIATINGESAQFRILAVLTEGNLLQVVATYPVHAPAAKRVESAEFCTRINYGLRLGNLQLNMEDGMVRLHASAPFEDGDLQPAIIERCIGTALLLADHYFPHLMSVFYGGVTAAHAANLADLALAQGRN